MTTSSYGARCIPCFPADLEADAAWLKEAGAGGTLAIGAGSTERVLMVEIVPEGDGGEVDLCLVGKGVTFDSGGLSLKPPRRLRGQIFKSVGLAVQDWAIARLLAGR